MIDSERSQEATVNLMGFKVLQIVRVVLWTSRRRILNDPPWSIAMAMNLRAIAQPA